MAKILPVSEVRARLPEPVSAVEQFDHQVIVTRHGRPAAMETLDVLSDPELMRQIRASEAHFAAGKRGLSFDPVFGEPLTKPRRKHR